MSCGSLPIRLLLTLTLLALTAAPGCGGGDDDDEAGEGEGEGEAGEGEGEGGGEGEGEGEGGEGEGGEGEGEADGYRLILPGTYVSLIPVRTQDEVYYERHYGTLHDEPYILVVSTLKDDGLRHISEVDLESGDANELIALDPTETDIVYGAALPLADDWLAIWTEVSEYVSDLYLVQRGTSEVRELGNTESLAVAPDGETLLVTAKCEEQLTEGCRAYLHHVVDGTEDDVAADAVDTGRWTLEGGELMAVLHQDRTMEVLTWPEMEAVTTVDDVAELKHQTGAPGQTAFYYTVTGETDQDLWTMDPEGTSTLVKELVYDVLVDQRAIYYTTRADGAYVREHGADEETLVVTAGTIGGELDNRLEYSQESPEGGRVALHWSALSEAYLVDLDDPSVDTTIAISQAECGGFRGEDQYLHPCYDRPRLFDLTTGEDGPRFPSIGHVFGLSSDYAYAVVFTADKRPGVSLLDLEDPDARDIPIATQVSDIEERSRLVALWSAYESNVFYYATNTPGADTGLYRYEILP